MNVELLQRVKKQILEEPKRFAMGRWIVHESPGTVVRPNASDLKRTVPSCGTVACIAGWAIVLEGKEFDNGYSQYKAELLLGISSIHSGNLFFTEQWTPHYKKLWRSTRSLKKRAVIAAKVIDNFIKKNS